MNNTLKRYPNWEGPVTLIAAGGAAITLGGHVAGWTSLVLVGCCVTGYGLLWFLLRLFGFLFARSSWAAIRMRSILARSDLVLEAMESRHHAVLEAALVKFGLPEESCPRGEHLEDLLRSGGSIFFAVRFCGTNRYVGVFCLHGLSALGVRRMRAGVYDGFRKLSPEDLSRSLRRPKGIYIVLVAAHGARARAAVLSSLQQALIPYMNLPIFARPMTPDGVRSSRNYGLQPLPSSAEIWIRQ